MIRAVRSDPIRSYSPFARSIGCRLVMRSETRAKACIIEATTIRPTRSFDSSSPHRSICRSPVAKMKVRVEGPGVPSDPIRVALPLASRPSTRGGLDPRGTQARGREFYSHSGESEPKHAIPRQGSTGIRDPLQTGGRGACARTSPSVNRSSDTFGGVRDGHVSSPASLTRSALERHDGKNAGRSCTSASGQSLFTVNEMQQRLSSDTSTPLHLPHPSEMPSRCPPVCRS